MNEIKNSTIGSAIKKSNMIGREIQSRNMLLNAINSLNEKYSFTVKSDNYYVFDYTFSVIKNSTRSDGYAPILLVLAKDNKNNSTMFLEKYDNIICDYPRHESVKKMSIGFVIDNLKAGQRMKLNAMLDAINEINEPEMYQKKSEVKMVSESKIRKMVREILKEVLDNSDEYITDDVYAINVDDRGKIWLYGKEPMDMVKSYEKQAQRYGDGHSFVDWFETEEGYNAAIEQYINDGYVIEN